MTCNTIRNSNCRRLSCPMKSESRLLQNNSASSITRWPIGEVSVRLVAKALLSGVAIKQCHSLKRIVA